MFCSKCGKKQESIGGFCTACGVQSKMNNQTPDVHHDNFNQNVRSNGSKLRKDFWKPLLIIIVVVGFIAWGVISENNDNSNLVSVDEYWCTEYHEGQAILLQPNEDFNDVITKIEIMENELALLENEVNNMYFDENSQESVDNYNLKYDVYEDKYDIYEKEHAAMELLMIASDGSMDEYNRKVDEYNNYLATNCD